MTAPENLHHWNSVVGEYLEGDHAYRVEVTARIERPHSGEAQTVEHEPITDPIRFAISGVEYEKRRNRWDDVGGGQNIDSLRKVTNFRDGWDASKRDKLVALWEEWHLNDMQAGCVHQTVEYETNDFGRRQPSLTQTKPCEQSGYRYGTAWLVKPIPESVITEITDLFSKVES